MNFKPLAFLMGGACTAYAPSTDQHAGAAPVVTQAVTLPTAMQIVAADVPASRG